MATAGSVIVLVVIVITITMLEVAMLSLILTRSLGDEGVLLTQNQVARRGAETALTRIANSLSAYVATSGTTNVDTAFAAGGSNDIENVALTATDPEDSSADATNVTISAWLQERRGTYYHIVGKATYGDVSLESHRWLIINPCSSSAISSLTGLTTVLHTNSITYYDLLVDQRLGEYFYLSPHTGSHFYAWSASSGLSTLVTGSLVGFQKTVLSSYTGRVYFSDNNRLWSWHSSTGLSTLLNISNIGSSTLSVFNTSGEDRVFFGADDAKGMRSWSSSKGLSTLVPNEAWVGEESSLYDPLSGRVYLGQWDTANDQFWSWHPSTGLSTIISLSSRVKTGLRSMGIYSSLTNPRVFFGENRSTGSIFYTWSPSTGLSTLVSGGSYLGTDSVRVDQSGRVFFGSGDGRLYTWHTSTGLSTLVFGRSYPGMAATALDPNTGRFFFGEQSTNLWSWHSSTGLSTLFSAGCNPGYAEGIPSSSHRTGNFVTNDWNVSAMWVNPNSGRLYFGNNCNGAFGRFYTWANSTGLSLIKSGLDQPGAVGALGYDSDDERVYFGEEWTEGGDSLGGFYTYSPSSGLSTIIFGAYTNIGSENMLAVDPVTGRVMWAAQKTDGVGTTIWSWAPATTTTSQCD